MESKKALIIGNGSAAIWSCALAKRRGYEVYWLEGTGTRILPPTPGVSPGIAAEAFVKLGQDLEIPLTVTRVEFGLREYKNKAFRLPAWAKAQDEEEKKGMIEAQLAPEERFLASAEESFFQSSFYEMEESLRAQLLEHHRSDRIPIQKCDFDAGFTLSEVELGSGEKIRPDLLIFADRWDQVPAIEGIEKGLPFLRRRGAVSLLQVLFEHATPIPLEPNQSMMVPLQREAGEEKERHAWGYFFHSGHRSLWTIALTQEQAEDNHEIAKKLRRLKQALSKVFVASQWIESDEELSDSLRSESVNFAEHAWFTQGEPLTQPMQYGSSVYFITDAYGVSSMLEQLQGITPLHSDVKNTVLSHVKSAVLNEEKNEEKNLCIDPSHNVHSTESSPAL